VVAPISKTMNNRIQAVLFDLDGTLINTDSVIFASFQYVLSMYFPLREWTYEERLSWLGPSLPMTFRRYLSEAEIDQAVSMYRTHNATHQKDYVTIFPYVKETLHYLHEHGYLLVL
jgi:phosphoglycolate phosphatase-like HAD superfamily hydrolase